MGTPDFAAASLEKLCDDGFEICAVFTQPDKQRGRGMQLSYSPVKELALSRNIPVFQPESLRGESVLELVRNLNPDVIAVVAYGKLIPDELIGLAKYGAVNLHGSLLPKLRGAAPIQRAIANGDRETGVCITAAIQHVAREDIRFRTRDELTVGRISGQHFLQFRDQLNKTKAVRAKKQGLLCDLV